MLLRDKSKYSSPEEKDVPQSPEENTSALQAVLSQLVQQNQALIQKMDNMGNRIDNIDRTNKKFLLTAMSSGITPDKMKEELKKQKKKIILLADQCNVLMSLINNEKLQEGLLASHRKTAEILGKLGIEEIPVEIGEKFNPSLHQCVEAVYEESQPDNVVLELSRSGYRDTDSGEIIRCAEVVVNDKSKGEKQ